ncbi:DNA-binding transcriptional regulator, XRE-family HTH domain [Anaerosporobacter mobilis DSM 15930]|uniref:DNA-binding transcriptional regulator, XRE-family HTH domain n=1 Tax=Anaerosporobacter mobilis DSM 15930 TaxID=1120996 RepID=A0A1M7LHD2_9FIRM|nr:helix-turn-helix transcriptional regulator [Anaerosporobacter mobilis]SHM77056.1 DNA-binding transcriptional regulator, XRE-family HTH domain [Anaerosporobacter mobilis DSM 15930]
MELHERIRHLRKNELKLTQEKFGELLGVSRSVINNLERNVLAKPEQKEPLYKLICKEFNVNPDWLYNGNEPIFNQVTDDEFLAGFIGDMLKDEEMTPKKAFFKAFANLPDEFFIKLYEDFKQCETYIPSQKNSDAD